MTLSNTAAQKIAALSNAITNLITTHSNKTASSSEKGHAQSSSQVGRADISGGAVGTDNGIYARADHQHVLSDAYATASHSQATTTVTNSETYTNIGSNLTNQKIINDNINTKIGNIESEIGDIHTLIYGTNEEYETPL